MADFIAFGKGVLDMTSKCACNPSRGDVAMFLMAQQKAIQEDTIKRRLAGASAPSGGNGSKPAAGPKSALERMREMAGIKK